MNKFITQDKVLYAEEQIKQIKDQPNQKKYQFNELRSTMFDNEEYTFDKEIKLNAILSFIGHYHLPNNLFGVQTCPNCGKDEVIPYFLSGSVLSGMNIFKGYCTNCKTKSVYSDYEQYIKVKSYVLEHKNELINLQGRR